MCLSVCLLFSLVDSLEFFFVLILRAMFIIDDQGIIRQITINDRLVGRNVTEALRLIKTIQYAAQMREITPGNGFTEGLKDRKICV